MANTNNDIEELEELLTELEGQEAQLVAPYSEDDDAVTQLMDAPLGDQEWMVQVTALDRRMMSTDQLHAELSSGRISSRTLVWRSGMDDWLPVARVDELARASRPVSSPMAVSPMSVPLPPPPAPMPPRSSISQLPPPPAPLPPPVSAWSSVGSSPHAAPVALPPPPAVPSQQPLVAPTLSQTMPSQALPPPPSSPSSPKPELSSSRANTTRPVAVDFSELQEAAPAPMRGKRMLMALSAAAVLTVFVGGYTMMSDGGADKAAAATKPAQPTAVAALQPPPATTPKQEAPKQEAPAVAEKPAAAVAEAPAPAPAAEPEAPAAEESSSRATTAPARYAMRSEYRRRARASGTKDSASDDSESESTPAAKPAPEAPSAPAEEPSEPAAAVADDDADAEQAPKSGKSNNTFNREAATKALDEAAQQAKNCRPAGGPSGNGRVQVRYEPSGKVASVAILTSKFENTDAGSCVKMVFRRARVPEFTGAPTMIVNKSFEIP